jgi:UDP-N-acetylmuramoylalanine--D-glutamate ligase
MLSPAAASLDQFSSYAQRGKEFKKFVSSLSLN